MIDRNRYIDIREIDTDLWRPVLDVSGAVNNGVVGAVPGGAEAVPLAHPVEVAQGLGGDVANLHIYSAEFVIGIFWYSEVHR